VAEAQRYCRSPIDFHFHVESLRSFSSRIAHLPNITLKRVPSAYNLNVCIIIPGIHKWRKRKRKRRQYGD